MSTRSIQEKVARQPFIITDGTGLKRVPGPAVVLINPKHIVNVASMIRNCAALGINTLCYTGERVEIYPNGKGANRVPREERMREYETVIVIHNDFPMRFFRDDVVPVGVEIMTGALPLPLFEHPDQAVYIFGPEDGSIPTGWRALCHHFVQIPSIHCFNLAQAGGIMLYDRMVSRWREGKGDLLSIPR
jgi:tRNA(Leu) C34 or U34 (ribose-2'-O)-methylase TrmL